MVLRGRRAGIRGAGSGVRGARFGSDSCRVRHGPQAKSTGCGRCTQEVAQIKARACGRKRDPHVVDEYPVIPRFGGVAIGDVGRRHRARNRERVSPRAAVRARRTDSALVNIDSEQHCRGTRASRNADLPPTRSNRVGFACGARHSAGNRVSTGVDRSETARGHYIRAETLSTVVARSPAFARVADYWPCNDDRRYRGSRVAHSISGCLRTALRTPNLEPPDPGSRIPGPGTRRYNH
jgi:hypothetical protein